MTCEVGLLDSRILYIARECLEVENVFGLFVSAEGSKEIVGATITLFCAIL